MDMAFWFILAEFVVGAIAYCWGHWVGYGEGEADTIQRVKDYERQR